MALLYVQYYDARKYLLLYCIAVWNGHNCTEGLYSCQTSYECEKVCSEKGEERRTKDRKKNS